jgi:type I restriction-modification system DNA methylase subunit
MNKFEDAFVKLCGDLNEDPIKVLDDSLSYIVCRLCTNNHLDVAWQYGEKENEQFSNFFMTYALYLQEKLKEVSWYDAWGDLFMDLSGSFKSMRGQFFTPPGVADLTARCSSDDTTGMKIINDCACGSARMLLAAFIQYQGNTYLVGEDIDGICCKMAAVNLAVHGCTGEIIRHDSLKEPGEFRYGYLINESILESGIPSIRISREKKDFWKFRNTIMPKEQRQLTLF